MKSLLLGMIILCFNLGLKSQNYHHFPESNAIWHSLAFQFSETDYDYHEMFSHKYFINGDTVIENETWNKIYFTNNYLGDVEIRGGMNYIAAIRENEQKQILAKFPELPEFVLYDFTLEIGDTIRYDYTAASIVEGNFPIYFLDDEAPHYKLDDEAPHYKVVVDKDSVLLENGQYRNRLILQSFLVGYGDLHINNHWIEGFGCTEWSGLFHPIVVMRHDNGDHIKFACFMQDEVVIYLDNPYCDDCLCETFTFIDHFDGTNKVLIVYPNPSKGCITININGDYTGNAILLITDISGKKLFEKQVRNQKELNLDLSSYKGGFFIIHLLDLKTNKILESKKIIIQ